MNIGIVGMGLIGGSMAKTLKENTDHKIFAYDIKESTMLQAKLTHSFDEVLDDNTIGECDVIIVSLYPGDIIKYISDNCKKIKKGSVVIDCAGVKKVVCEPLEKIANENGFYFIGGHPMAGTQFWGFEYSRSTLFKGASMIMTVHGINDIGILEKMKKLFLSIGFAYVTFTTPDEHDKIIAYTSQLCHIVSSAFIKSPTALERKGFCAGSYKDMTRVAKLNEEMWTELFFDNKDYLINEIDTLICHLQEYSDSLKDDDREQMKKLLKEGRETKKQAG